MKLFNFLVFAAILVVASTAPSFLKRIEHFVEGTHDSRYLMAFPPVATVADPETNQLMLYVSGIYYALDNSDFSANYSVSAHDLPSHSTALNQVIDSAFERGQAEISRQDMTYRLGLFKASKQDSEPLKLQIAVGNVDVNQSFIFGDNFLVGKDTDGISQVSVNLVTDEDGYFEARVPLTFLPNKPINGSLRLSKYTEKFPVRLSFAERTKTIGTVVHANVLTQYGISVVSDVDDTIKVSNITTNLLNIFVTAIYHKNLAVKGMSELYNQWHSEFSNPLATTSVPTNAATQTIAKAIPSFPGTNYLLPVEAQRQQKYASSSRITFHYLSGSSWTLAPPYYNDFLNALNFPNGTLTSKNNFVGLADAISSPKASYAAIKTPPAGTSHAYSQAPAVSFSANSTIPFDSREVGTFLYKATAINKLVYAAPTTRNFVFLGDSTESDAEVYTNAVETWGWTGQTSGLNHTGRVQCVFMRCVIPTTQLQDTCEDDPNFDTCMSLSADDFRQAYKEKIDKLFAVWPEQRVSRVKIFNDGTDLQGVNLKTGEC